MFDNKGQSALEYLMTYGWALIVIAIVIGVLIFVTSGATGGAVCQSSSTGIVVNQASISSTNGVGLSLQNSTGYDLNITGVSASGGISAPLSAKVKDTNLAMLATTPVSVIKNSSVSITGLTVSQNSLNGGKVDVSYAYSASGLAGTATISCNGTVS